MPLNVPQRRQQKTFLPLFYSQPFSMSKNTSNCIRSIKTVLHIYF
uniref:Uncharacterized protein n=1 Tax=Anguilla anguilla TaxID=7936 RepID=A0A0E9WDV3_ANGAN